MLDHLPFRPRRLVSGKHFQTVYNVLFPPRNLLRTQFVLEDILIPLKDGDRLWLEHNPPLAWNPPIAGTVPFNGAYIVLIHGMEGSSESHYMLSIGRDALSRGYGVVRMNLRNCGKGLGYARKPYNAGLTSDLEAVLKLIKKRFQPKYLAVTGVSLSANLVLKYFGEERRNPIANTFAAVSPPIDLKKTCEFIDSKKGQFYRNHFLKSLHEKIRTGIYEMTPSEMERALTSKTFFDFDDYVTAPLSGFSGVLDYYSKCSSIHFIPKIKTPGIVIHAEDDPVVPSEVWKKVEWEKVPNIKPILTEKGGHVGFIGEPLPDQPDGRWLNKIILDYFDLQLKPKRKK